MTTAITRRQVEARTGARAVMLLTVLGDALSACEEQDLGPLHGRAPAGTALCRCRRSPAVAAAALGVEPGVHLTEGPGGGRGARPGGLYPAAGGVLAYLVGSRAPVPRDRLVPLLLPDADGGLAALRWNLAQLRRVTGRPQSFAGCRR